MPLRLEFSGSPELAVDREVVWRRLVDLQFVTQSTPGVESVEMVAPGRYRIASALKIGPVKVQLTTEAEILEPVEGRSAKLRAVTDATGSTVDMVSTVRLEDGAPGRTVLHWAATTEVDGALAGLGAMMMEGFLRKLTADFWNDFAQRVQAES